MSEIRFKGKPGWYPNEVEKVVNRVARIVCGTPMVFKKENGYRWQLDGSNNWWMDFDENTEEFILAYRYGSGGNGVYFQNLQKVIPWLLGCESFNTHKSD